MKKNRFVLAAVVTLIGAFGACAPAFATVSFTNSFTTFQSLSITSLEATFEGILTEGIISNPYTEGRVTFTNPSNLYNARPGGPAAVFDFDAPVTSNVLTVSGNEDITMTFSGPAPTAVGFTSLTNRFDAPTVSVFDLSNSLIGSYVLTQSPGTVGFVGITSSVGIGSVRWLALTKARARSRFTWLTSKSAQRPKLAHFSAGANRWRQLRRMCTMRRACQTCCMARRPGCGVTRPTRVKVKCSVSAHRMRWT